MPVLGRRGLTIPAIGAVDTALWDLLARSLDVPLAQILGGACRDSMPAYASGGWADADGRPTRLVRRAGTPSRCASARWTGQSSEASLG